MTQKTKSALADVVWWVVPIAILLLAFTSTSAAAAAAEPTDGSLLDTLGPVLENVALYLTVAVTLAIALLNIIAPLTKSETDNKILDWLRKFESLVLKALLPQMRGAKPPADPPAP